MFTGMYTHVLSHSQIQAHFQHASLNMNLSIVGDNFEIIFLDFLLSVNKKLISFVKPFSKVSQVTAVEN